MSTIEFQTGLGRFAPEAFEGFCAGWAAPLSGERLHTILLNSQEVVLATEGDRVVGFVNALSDRTSMAFIPLLEVRPSHQGRGIGSELIKRMIERLRGFYSIDLVCDEALALFYENLGFIPGMAMMRRNYGSGS